MSKPDPHIFDPSDLAKHAGVPVDMQRDWRRRGILPSEDLPGFCIRQSNGRWRFTFEGLRWVYSIARFAENGFDLVSATKFSSELIAASREYINYRNGGGQSIPEGFRRYLSIFPAQPNEKPLHFGTTTLRKWSNKIVRDLDELCPDRPEFLHVVDIVSFTDTWAKNLELPNEKIEKLQELIACEGAGGGADG